MSKKHEMHGRIAERLFYFTRKDLRTLRNKVRNVDEDITNGAINKMQRRELVEKLVGHENGFLALKRYQAQVRKWDKDHAFVGYRAK